MNSCTSPTPSVRIFPISKETRAPSASRFVNLSIEGEFVPVLSQMACCTHLCSELFSNLSEYFSSHRSRYILEHMSGRVHANICTTYCEIGCKPLASSRASRAVPSGLHCEHALAPLQRWDTQTGKSLRSLSTDHRTRLKSRLIWVCRGPIRPQTLASRAACWRCGEEHGSSFE